MFYNERNCLVIAAAGAAERVLTMSAADGANLLLGLVAVVGVVSTLSGMACVFWVTRARHGVHHTPAGHHFQAAQGAR